MWRNTSSAYAIHVIFSKSIYGQPLPVMDALLVATAQCHGLTIVTRNLQDFAPYPQIFNPWAL